MIATAAALGLWSRIRDARAYLTLLAVAAGAAALYAWGAIGHQQRDALAYWIDGRCATAGIRADADPGKMRATCRAAIEDLAAFRADALRASHDNLVTLNRERDEKLTRDLAAARAASDAAAAAATAMEQANASVPTSASSRCEPRFW